MHPPVKSRQRKVPRLRASLSAVCSSGCSSVVARRVVHYRPAWLRSVLPANGGPVASGPVASGPVASGPVTSGPVASGASGAGSGSSPSASTSGSARGQRGSPRGSRRIRRRRLRKRVGQRRTGIESRRGFFCRSSRRCQRRSERIGLTVTRIGIAGMPFPAELLQGRASQPRPTTAPPPPTPKDMAEISTDGASSGHRIFVDDKVMGETPALVQVTCGAHVVKIGSAGKIQNVDIPVRHENLDHGSLATLTTAVFLLSLLLLRSPSARASSCRSRHRSSDTSAALRRVALHRA